VNHSCLLLIIPKMSFIKYIFLRTLMNIPPIQWVSGALSLGAKRAEREADHSI